MSQTFADKLFNELSAINNNSYKLDTTTTKFINMECSNDGGINNPFGIYGLDYMFGSAPALTISEKVGDLKLNIKNGTIKTFNETTDINKLQLNIETKQISGGWKIENDDNLIGLNFEYEFDNKASLSNLDFWLCYDNYDIFRIGTTRFNINSESKIVQLPAKNNIELSKFSIRYHQTNDTLPTESMNNITIKDMKGNIIWKFNIIKQSDNTFKITIPESGGQAPYYVNYYERSVGGDYNLLYNVFAYGVYYENYQNLKFYGDKIYDGSNNQETTSENFENLAMGVSNGHNLGENHYELDYSPVSSPFCPIHIEYDNGVFVNCYIIESYLTLSDILNTFDINLYPVFKPYPALYIYDDNRLKGDYKNKLSEGIAAINSTVMDVGVICPLPSFVINPDK